jgi:hypothetical protein
LRFFNAKSFVLNKLLFLISNFRRYLNVVFFLLGDFLAYEFYMLTFRNTECSIFIGGVSRQNNRYETGGASTWGPCPLQPVSLLRHAPSRPLFSNWLRLFFLSQIFSSKLSSVRPKPLSSVNSVKVFSLTSNR